MKLHISSDRTIGQIQDEFAAEYPNLKLVFFSKAHKAYKGSPAKYLISDRETTIGSMLQGKEVHAELFVEPEMPVWQLERLFELEYHLHIQVFRRSGNTWLETSVTDDLSLEDQEVKGKDSLRHQYQFVDPLDYKEQD
ncbi:MAG: hypothetical protein JNJ57_19705 [Saprospiraceae bacterium]|nr:hypothetical protein [Saprospiraceae bacterium]